MSFGRLDRRNFLVSAAGMMVAGFGAPATLPAPLRADPPVKLSCNLYSFDALLRSGEASLDEVL
jgi:hypothetical protein